ncbi:hypothetical protein VNI00_019300 [Paramarasmius palmivorus]|uniref:Uncharacterized protein n=1 Tax=Paramarasmius palmivorus TaxID=297713 RepID=A0AAW0AQQ3_9AGAR
MEAVARLSQLPLPFFDTMDIKKSKPERTVVKTDGGRLRFEFDLRNNRMEPDWNVLRYSFGASLQDTWLSQSSKIFNEINVTDIETERYFTFCAHGSISIYSRSEIGYRDRSIPIQDDQAPEEACKPPHVYLFIEPPPLSVMESRTWMGNPYFWSFDEIGESKVSEDECYRWDLPKVWATYCPEFQTWKKDNYAALKEWQVARGFDPKTSDWARSMGYPAMEVIGARRPDQFEEVADNTPNMPGSWKD